MRDLGGSGIEPVSPALASEFFATEPPGKPPIPFVIELVDRANAGAQPEFLLGPHMGFSDCHAIVSCLNSSACVICTLMYHNECIVRLKFY